MIDLNHQAPFAAGYNRTCYRHPDDPRLCLKVLRPENIEARFARQPWYKKLLGRDRINDNRQEIIAHRQIAALADPQQAWRHLPRFHGSIDTTLGPANVSELITETDGQPGTTLERYLEHNGRTTEVERAIGQFADWLRQTGLLTRNLLPHNLVLARRDDRLTLYLVDGLGAPTVPTRLTTIPAYRSRYIARKLARFRQRIDWEIRGRPGSWTRAEKL
ncbi:hypothetical protein EZI54_10675 [Marinobacter halodurans]|uniref:PhoP regulatory network protein YrbL n=2 Tax=Marinobacter halodurans TaxID=2528979 RepID=A0ABY1ZKD3_9GAMM|nr:hypothetical protein EZI54_10675 [Marinobacter halodurans]